MKIRNELVSIKIGNKQYDFHNLIMDEYLKRFALAQLDEENMTEMDRTRNLEYCLLKFDTPLEGLSPSSRIYNQDFDVCIVFNQSHTQQINENQITVEYSYPASGSLWDYSNEEGTGINFSQLYGKKITAIGFNVWPFSYNADLDKWDYPVCSILDVSNYNIYLQENQEVVITRRDIIETDAIFCSNNKQIVPGPAHLAPYGLPEIIKQPLITDDDGGGMQYHDNAYGIIYSIGLSSYPDYIDKEYIIGADIQVEQNGTELIIKDIKNYLATDSSIFCSKDLYPNSSLYSVKSNYKYVLLKYKVWQEVHSGTADDIIITPTDTGYYYYMAIPIDKFGKSNLKIKYERG